MICMQSARGNVKSRAQQPLTQTHRCLHLLCLIRELLHCVGMYRPCLTDSCLTVRLPLENFKDGSHGAARCKQNKMLRSGRVLLQCGPVYNGFSYVSDANFQVAVQQVSFEI